jgi:hypothetical protein
VALLTTNFIKLCSVLLKLLVVDRVVAFGHHIGFNTIKNAFCLFKLMVRKLRFKIFQRVVEFLLNHLFLGITKKSDIELVRVVWHVVRNDRSLTCAVDPFKATLENLPFHKIWQMKNIVNCDGTGQP